MEESILKQKAKAHFLEETDGNSSFFDAVVKQKKKQSIIHKVVDVQGSEFQADDDIAATFVEFYKGLMGYAQEVQVLDQEWIKNGTTIHAQHQALLSSSVTSDEIKTAIFGMDDNRTLGFDGFNSGFSF